MMSVSVLSVYESKSSRPQGVNKGFFSFDAFNGFDFLALGICLISFVCSIIEARVNVDNLHWGWAYIAALDLKRGAVRIPKSLSFTAIFIHGFRAFR